MRDDLAADYEDGASIRDLVADYDLSYGLTRVLLLEAGVQLRDRGASIPWPGRQ